VPAARGDAPPAVICYLPPTSLPPTTTSALALALYDFANTSQIAVLLTRDLGKVRGLAKGARRPNGSFQGGLDFGAVYDVTLHARTEGLDLLARAEMSEPFPGLRRDLGAFHAAFYALELANLLTVEHDPQPDFFRVAVDTLRLLDRGAPRDLVLFAFEAAAMRLLGFMPRVEACASCGKGLPARPAFSPRLGGALCAACAPKDPGANPVAAGALKTLARLAEGAIPLGSLQIGDQVGRDLRAAFDLFWLNLMGREVRSARFLR
jgi:DNA repair protein RecO (recombination protein O)